MHCSYDHSATRWSPYLGVLFYAIHLIVSGCAILGGSPIQHARGYNITSPKSWKPADQGESDKAYRLPSGNLVTLTSSCNRSDHVSLEVLTKHLLIGARDVTITERETIEVNGAQGLHSSVHAAVEGAPFEFELVVFEKNSCIFDFTLMSPRKFPPSDIQEFMTYVRSFTFGKN